MWNLKSWVELGGRRGRGCECRWTGLWERGVLIRGLEETEKRRATESPQHTHSFHIQRHSLLWKEVGTEKFKDGIRSVNFGLISLKKVSFAGFVCSPVFAVGRECFDRVLSKLRKVSQEFQVLVSPSSETEGKISKGENPSHPGGIRLAEHISSQSKSHPLGRVPIICILLSFFFFF